MAEKEPIKMKEEKKKIEAKPLPVDKEKTKEIEEKMKESKPTEKMEEKENPKEKTPEKPTMKVKKKTETKPKVKKEEAVARGNNYPISKKHSMYISDFIKNKSIDSAISDLNNVIKFKKAVPFKGEIPHRKGPMASGRYPIKASKYFINILKGLKGNVIMNGMELEKTRIFSSSASWAVRPMRRGGRSAKRTNIIIKAKEFTGGKR